ncbi:hypothetical protein V7S43_005699 [Phytophthora oleae]|uniref:Tubby C-terminal domain-containing protein n=1 Tax=Phytophthora oleae TaxID=2107226 RepID=A0ABD3FTN4_9STRA
MFEDKELDDNDDIQLVEQKRRRIVSRSVLDKDAMVIEKLGDDPDLLDRFLEIRSRDAHGSMNQAGTATTPTAQAADAALDPPPSRKKSEPTSKYAFIPQPDQQYAHDLITSSKHRGKNPNVYVTGLVRSETVQFKALSGVCTRVFDFRFGPKGLSISRFLQRIALLGCRPVAQNL